MKREEESSHICKRLATQPVSRSSYKWVRNQGGATMDLISARSAICDWLPMWGKIPKHALPRVHEALRALIQSHGGLDWVNARAGCRVVKRQVFRSGSFRKDFYDDI